MLLLLQLLLVVQWAMQFVIRHFRLDIRARGIRDKLSVCVLLTAAVAVAVAVAVSHSVGVGLAVWGGRGGLE